MPGQVATEDRGLAIGSSKRTVGNFGKHPWVGAGEPDGKTFLRGCRCRIGDSSFKVFAAKRNRETGWGAPAGFGCGNKESARMGTGHLWNPATV